MAEHNAIEREIAYRLAAAHPLQATDTLLALARREYGPLSDGLCSRLFTRLEGFYGEWLATTFLNEQDPVKATRQLAELVPDLTSLINSAIHQVVVKVGQELAADRTGGVA